MKFGLNKIMQQAQEMQEKMKKAQEELAHKEVIGESGAGLVKITMNGRYSATRVELNESLMQEDKDVVEDLICAAINDTIRRVEEMSKGLMGDVTGGMQMPEGFDDLLGGGNA